MRSARMSSAKLWSLEATAVSSAHALPSPLPAALIDRGAKCVLHPRDSIRRARAQGRHERRGSPRRALSRGILGVG
jgi:hypothetical protein